MQASSTLPALRSGINGLRGSARFAKVGEASAYLGCSPSQVRLLMGSGELSGYTSEGGTRWISWISLLAYTGEDECEALGEKGQEKGIAIYVRCSSQSQSDSLDRQRKRLIDEVCQREGVKEDGVAVYSDLSSSFYARASLNVLLDDIIDGKIKKVFVESFNRWSRIPAVSAILDHICKRFGVELIALDREDTDPNSQEVWMKEVLDYLAVFCNRQAAQKSKTVTCRSLTPESIEAALQLKAKGWNLTRIWKELNKRKLTNSHGEAISYFLLKKYFDENGVQTAVSTVIGAQPLPHPPVEQFLQKHLQILPEGGYDGKAVRVKTKDLYRAYTAFCKQRKVEVDAHSNFGLALKKVIPPSRKLRTMGYTCWLGCRLVGLNSKAK